MNLNNTISAFISDVKQILAENPYDTVDLERIAERMQTLLANPVIREWREEPSGNIHTGRQSSPLYKDDSGLTLMHARFGPENMTSIHNHNSWGVVGLYRGRDRYQIWRRLDEGHGTGKAQVELVEERVLEPGDVAIMPPPPQDIHAQQGFEGEAAYEFVLFGSDPTGPRLYFDPTQGTAQHVQL